MTQPVDTTVGVQDLAPGAGVKSIDASTVTRDDASTAQRERLSIADPVDAKAIASVDDDSPRRSDYGVATRSVPGETENRMIELLELILDELRLIRLQIS